MSKNTSAEYSVWKAMRRRCFGLTSSGFSKYGARGIGICPEWDSFDAFFADMGPRPSAFHSIDRVDNSGNYCPENCRWVLPKQQARNKRNTRMVFWDGKYQSLAGLCEDFGLRIPTVKNRLSSNWKLEDALKTPARKLNYRIRSSKLTNSSSATPKSGLRPFITLTGSNEAEEESTTS